MYTQTRLALFHSLRGQVTGESSNCLRGVIYSRLVCTEAQPNDRALLFLKGPRLSDFGPTAVAGDHNSSVGPSIRTTGVVSKLDQ
ncbi:hypothetical protein RRG08_014280 [Elysia crispata]|uniref:Uncharacterized protein n=1 Tax=Elysia crispata TaxID=231223 RepID=A0AAE1CQI9_9GAST|nr:hypothetical protein RRG08_014280 [Elysia crispata]